MPLCIQSIAFVYYNTSLSGRYLLRHDGNFINIPVTRHIKQQYVLIYRTKQSSTTRIVRNPLLPSVWQFLHKATRCLPPSTVMLEGGGRNGRGATGLNVLQVAGVAEKVTIQRVAAVTLLVVQLHLAFLAVIAFHVIVFVHGHDSNGFIRSL